jgi:hypothetical protein
MRSVSRLSNAQEFQKFSHSRVIFDDCDQLISRSWKGINGRDIGLVEYKGLIEKCSTLPTYFEEQIQDYNNDVSSTFESMRDNFASYFFLNASDPDPGEMINNLVGVQSLHLINTFSELTRFREAVLSCQSQLIPQSFLKASRMEKVLQELKLKLLPLKYTVATQSISKLYKMPIADCVFGTTTLTVQILLPVVKTDVNFSLLKFTYPNFLYKDQLCRLKSHDGMRWDEDSESYLYERNSKTLIRTGCKSNDRDLCHIPDQSQRPMINKCIFEVLNASFEGIREECSFQCHKLSPSYKKLILPIIKRVSSSKFVITLDRITTMLIKCDGKHDELISPQEYGAVEITLPCSCYIMYHSEKFYSRNPCGNSLFVSHVIPEHMVNASVTKESKFFLTEPSDKVNMSLIADENIDLLDLSSIIGKNTSSSAVDITFESGESSQGLAFVAADQSFINTKDSDGECFRGHIYLWVFVIAQTIVFIAIVVTFYFRLGSIDKKCDYGRSAVCFSVSQMTNLDENK